MYLTHLPGPMGVRLRYEYYSRRLKRCGRSVIIEQGVLIKNPQFISFGDDVFIDQNCILSAGPLQLGKCQTKSNPAYGGVPGELHIGSHVHLAQGCLVMAYGGVEIAEHCVASAGSKLYSMTNTPNDPEDRSKIVSLMPYSQAPFLVSPVVLQRNVWVGLNCIVMPGVTLGRDSFAVSNSLVMDSFPPNSYLRGQPARRERERFAQATVP
jgi:acetyltransferase-like isoleucine patch superfamily enzyme